VKAAPNRQALEFRYLNAGDLIVSVGSGGRRMTWNRRPSGRQVKALAPSSGGV